MAAEVLVPVVVAVLAGGAGIVAALIGRRTAVEDRRDARWVAEASYLSDRLDTERQRTDRLEAEVAQCHTERDRDRAHAAQHIHRLEQRVDDMRATIRTLSAEVRDR